MKADVLFRGGICHSEVCNRPRSGDGAGARPTHLTAGRKTVKVKKQKPPWQPCRLGVAD